MISDRVFYSNLGPLRYVVAQGWVSSRDFLLGLAIMQAFPGPNFNCTSSHPSSAIPHHHHQLTTNNHSRGISRLPLLAHQHRPRRLARLHRHLHTGSNHPHRNHGPMVSAAPFAHHDVHAARCQRHRRWVGLYGRLSAVADGVPQRGRE